MSGAEAEEPSPAPAPPADAWADPPGGDWTRRHARTVAGVVPDGLLGRLGVTLEDGSRWVLGLLLEATTFRVLQLERREALAAGEPAPPEVRALVSTARSDLGARWLGDGAPVPPVGPPPSDEERDAFAGGAVVSVTVLDVALVAPGADGTVRVVPVSVGQEVQ